VTTAAHFRSRLVASLAGILLVSGFCSLVYQVVWLRLLRLVFGASTASSAAVLAIFMGGLGLGGLLLGRRVDRSPRPLTFYSRLEFGIAATAALTPPLVLLIRWSYVSLGGTAQLGTVPGTLLRLALSAVVLGLPTFLMGGTLPAAVRAIERTGDRGRRGVGLLYGVNTCGAVLGALWATFVSIELVGLRRSMWVAALLNVLIAVCARALARRVAEGEEVDTEPATEPEPTGEPAKAPAEAAASRPAVSRARLRLVLAAAFLVGFVFFLMELVWYRMLAPILGGSSYTFGLILAIALAGIGIGGLLYGFGAQTRRPTLITFAGTCALLALAVAFPYALGDRIAYLALATRGLGQAGLAGMVLGWTLVTAVVALPASLVAGYQFPVLVGLLGEGRKDVGREVGLTYAWNTAGAILGSVAGGFGLLPLLSAPGAWRLSAAVLAALAVVFLAAAALGLGKPRATARHSLGPALAALLALLLLGTTGPTAAWRHNGIGAGRIDLPDSGPNGVHRTFEDPRGDLVWEVEGVESSVALRAGLDYAFLINGKTDGSAWGDAPTQVMSGLVGALLHERPRQALVIGLGTGSSAGWLADVTGMERVDVVELEPAVARVARWMAPVNRNALGNRSGDRGGNPRLHLRFADAREHLLTTPETYDVIFSEPSNPYRAGISSLFTREFYRAVTERLEPGGIFLQWFQGYEVDTAVVRTAYATLLSVFPHVETWQVHAGDLLLVATTDSIEHDLDRIRRRVAEEPFASALLYTWGVSGVEGLYSGYVASPELAREVASQPEVRINTDDFPIIEFGFVRNLGRRGLFSLEKLKELARRRGFHRPRTTGGSLDWDRVDELAAARMTMLGSEPELPEDGLTGPHDRPRLHARRAYARNAFRDAVALWFSQPQPPGCRADLVMLAHSLARLGDERAPDYIERLRALRPLEADAALALWHTARREAESAVERLLRVLVAYRSDPWVYRPLMIEVLEAARGLGRRFPEAGREVFDALAEPFAVGLLEKLRLRARLDLAVGENFESLCLDALEDLEPHPFWEGEVLSKRLRCYRLHHHPLEEQALDDAATFLAAEPPPLLEETDKPRQPSGMR